MAERVTFFCTGCPGMVDIEFGRFLRQGCNLQYGGTVTCEKCGRVFNLELEITTKANNEED